MSTLREIIDMYKQDGIASLVAIGLAVGALGVGALLGKYAKPDSIPEQAIEAYLQTHDIDCDFSAEDDKK